VQRAVLLLEQSVKSKVLCDVATHMAHLLPGTWMMTLSWPLLLLSIEPHKTSPDFLIPKLHLYLHLNLPNSSHLLNYTLHLCQMLFKYLFSRWHFKIWMTLTCHHLHHLLSHLYLYINLQSQSLHPRFCGDHVLETTRKPSSLIGRLITVTAQSMWTNQILEQWIKSVAIAMHCIGCLKGVLHLAPPSLILSFQHVAMKARYITLPMHLTKCYLTSCHRFLFQCFYLLLHLSMDISTTKHNWTKHFGTILETTIMHLPSLPLVSLPLTTL
jgi:hypothetical protein